MATSKINNPMAWKLAGTATGSNTVSMPTEYNEILLWAQRSTTYFTAVVPKAEISASTVYPRASFYYRADMNDGIYFEVNSSTAKLGQWVQNGGNSVISSATFKLYYR